MCCGSHICVSLCVRVCIIFTSRSDSELVAYIESGSSSSVTNIIIHTHQGGTTLSRTTLETHEAIPPCQQRYWWLRHAFKRVVCTWALGETCEMSWSHNLVSRDALVKTRTPHQCAGVCYRDMLSEDALFSARIFSFCTAFILLSKLPPPPTTALAIWSRSSAV